MNLPILIPAYNPNELLVQLVDSLILSGVQDIVVVNALAVNRLYLNDGNGVSFTASDVSADTLDSRAVAVNDIDGDGDIDIVVGNYGQVNRLYQNNGSGVFVGSDIRG